jgi:hypothetical protein
LTPVVVVRPTKGRNLYGQLMLVVDEGGTAPTYLTASDLVITADFDFGDTNISFL